MELWAFSTVAQSESSLPKVIESTLWVKTTHPPTHPPSIHFLYIHGDDEATWQLETEPSYCYDLLHSNAIESVLCVMTTHPPTLSASNPSPTTYVHNDETTWEVQLGTILLVQSTPLQRNWQCSLCNDHPPIPSLSLQSTSIHLTSTARYIHNDDETIRKVDIGTILLVQPTPLKRNCQSIPFCSKRRVNVNP